MFKQIAMKKLTCLMIVLAFCHAASSQVLIAILFGDKLNTDKLEFGLMVSPTFTNISEITSDPKFGLGLSLYFNVKMSQNFFFRLEASPKAVFGAQRIPPYNTGIGVIDSIYAAEGSVERKIKALSLPLLLRYRLKGLLFAEGGIQVNWMTNAHDIFETKVDGNELTYTAQTKDFITRFDFGIAGGLEYKLKQDKGMGIGVRYFYGVTDMLKTELGTQRNISLMLNVSIPIGAGKANAKAAEVKK